jgi:ATP-binding cassette subfamily B protein
MNANDTVLNNVMLPLKIAGIGAKERKRRAMHALTIVGLESKAKNKANDLSGGQKQRISLARAYYKNAPIMIMDDTVSAVDMKTEENILHNVSENRKGLTTIVIASRVSTVRKLDRILVMKDGTVDAFDTHENLMKSSQTYQNMVYLQQLEAEVKGGNTND